MEILHKYETEIEEWFLKDLNQFIGSNTDNLEYEFGISPQDPNEPDCCYFNVGIIKTIRNSTNGIVFSAKVNTCFKVRNNNKIPTIEFCFDIIDSGTFEFAKIFNDRKKQTHISNKNIAIPMIEDFRNEIQKTINFWLRNIRNTGIN
ncbi:hypothetical protein [Flavobacterium dankookense]|uniref:Uncharacterized protein n=1 Tax=Flavobacterium dankookense TaxID=706186 RepID=A0A4R6QHQ6_9FLAO|nr:hypothetical protein [Flavobacterium dankookense]TDP61558.1 hypothetical protein BC748_0184 [Flavobacterium dankookense]